MKLLHLIIEKAIFRVDHVKYCRRNRRWVDGSSMPVISTNSFVFLFVPTSKQVEKCIGLWSEQHP